MIHQVLCHVSFTELSIIALEQFIRSHTGVRRLTSGFYLVILQLVRLLWWAEQWWGSVKSVDVDQVLENIQGHMGLGFVKCMSSFFSFFFFLWVGPYSQKCLLHSGSRFCSSAESLPTILWDRFTHWQQDLHVSLISYTFVFAGFFSFVGNTLLLTLM